MYVLVKSWHRVKTVTRAGWYLTLCGRTAKADALTSAELPGGKSCESCLRIMAR